MKLQPSVATKILYEEFLRAKVIQQKELGFELPPSAVHKLLKPHQRDMVLWALRKGRGAIFASFGLGKTMVQLEIARQVVKHESKNHGDTEARRTAGDSTAKDAEGAKAKGAKA